ncbi:hypothetical protein Salat_1449700 [Sesamum alatum]|uniref:Uncharacterized protein n=1 Tax=Sesamum alatum TaxID=300844 RepID=A0AAE1YB17_9LAMI|nr:hypothetical protein Salat_1449700 [Sesamum alatum]
MASHLHGVGSQNRNFYAVVVNTNEVGNLYAGRSETRNINVVVGHVNTGNPTIDATSVLHADYNENRVLNYANCNVSMVAQKQGCDMENRNVIIVVDSTNAVGNLHIESCGTVHINDELREIDVLVEKETMLHNGIEDKDDFNYDDPLLIELLDKT